MKINLRDSDTKEAITGYLFSLPIIITVGIFIIFPIFGTIYYSLTDYNPLEAKKFDVLINPLEYLENYGYYAEDYSSLEEINLDEFDSLNFILKIEPNLNEKQKDAIKRYFDKRKLFKNLLQGQLDKEMTVAVFMNFYMEKEETMFRKYVPTFTWLDNFAELFGVLSRAEVLKTELKLVGVNLDKLDIKLEGDRNPPKDYEIALKIPEQIDVLEKKMVNSGVDLDKVLKDLSKKKGKPVTLKSVSSPVGFEFQNSILFFIEIIFVILSITILILMPQFINGKRKTKLKGNTLDRIKAISIIVLVITGIHLIITLVSPDFGSFSLTIEWKDKIFWKSLVNTFYFAFVVVTIQTLLAVLLAVAANSKIRGVGFFKTTFFIPSITSAAAISMIFMLIYSKPGILNGVLSSIGILEKGSTMNWPDWLQNPDTALPAIMVMNIWTTAGYFMITFLAALQNIPNSIYESARVDGSNAFRSFFDITIPLLRPQMVFVMIMGSIGCMQVFDQIYFLIKNEENFTIAYYIYLNAFSYGRMGKASAMALILFFIILIITFLQRKFVKENPYG